MESVNALTALFAGALSFLSPCVLPIVPAYLGRLAALSAGTSRMRHALLFTCGFSAIFIALGISAGYVGGAAGRLLPILQIPVGVAVTIGGLHLAGLLRIPQLDRMRAPAPILRGGYLGSFLLGAAFAIVTSKFTELALLLTYTGLGRVGQETGFAWSWAGATSEWWPFLR
jgi:cytochrome c-type biogenesis protein